MALGHEGRAGIEHLVLVVARAEFGADRVPGELVELHLLERRGRGRLLGTLDQRRNLRIAEILRRRRQHDQAAARQLPNGVEDLRIKLLGQRLRCVERVPVRHEIAAVLVPLRFHRRHQRVDHAAFGRQLPERLAHLGEVQHAVDLGRAARQPDQEAHLHRQADHGLVVLIDVRRRGVELLLAHLQVLEDEDPLPRHLDVVEIEHSVVLVEPARQRIVEHRWRRGLVGLARQHGQALGVHRDRERQGVVLIAGLQRLDAGDEDFIGHDAAGRQHLGAAHRNALCILIHHAGGQERILLLRRALGAVGLRVDDDVGEIAVSYTHLDVYKRQSWRRGW